MTLTVIWLLPMVGSVLIAFMPPRFAKWSGVLVALAALAVAVDVAFSFQPGYRGYQYSEAVLWIPQLSIFYRLGIDGISLWLVVLNAFLTVIAILATPLTTRRLNRFVALLLAMSAGLAGVFLATDLVLFYVFWEAMLIPAYFMLWLFGEGDRPGRAAVKFVLYTLAGSLLMLVGVIGEYVATGKQTFDLATLATLAPSPSIQFALFFVFALAFAIKTPLFPFHSWLPDAYAAAPTPMLVTFAGVMGKAGAYGFLRIAIPLFPEPVGWWDWRWVVPVLAVAAIIWGALMAIAQRDMKLLVAYSSVSHMGFIVLGIFSYNVQGQQGAILQMVNHGIIISALFLIVAWISDRTGTRDRSAMAGMAARMPVMAGVFIIVTLAALGLPGLNSFVGEFMTLLGAWQRAPVLALFGAIGLVLAPVYMLRMFQGAMQGPPAGPVPKTDIYTGQLLVLAPLVLLMFAIGLDPNVLTNLMTSLGQVGLAKMIPLVTADLTYTWSQALADLGQVAAIVTLTGFFLFAIVVDLVLPKSRRGGAVAITAVTGFAFALAAAAIHWVFGQGGYAYHQFATGDTFALFFEVLFATLGILTVALSHSYLNKRGLLESEFHILIMAAVIGMMVLGAATSLVTVFLGLELLSIALYIACGFVRTDSRSQESAAKYLLVGGFASAFVLYGMALIYGGAGTTVIPEIASRLGASSSTNPLILLGIVLMGVGFAFKVSAAPFHMWTPDVYQGAPLPVTAFMSVGTKAAAFAMIVRVFSGGLPHLAPEWQALLAFVAATSMVVGNLMAIAQTSLKRLFAYSGVAQAGYILIGVIAGGQSGLSAVLYYLFVYMFMNFGAFAVITVLAGPDGDRDRFSDLEGLARRNPVMAVLMSIFMLSLAGFPPSVGFFGKLFLFTAGVSAGYTWLVVLAVIMSVVSVFYYVRVLLPVWSTSTRTDRVSTSLSSQGVLWLSGVASVALGVYPTTVLLLGQLGATPISGP